MEVAPVGQAGERVDVGEVTELAVRGLHLRDGALVGERERDRHQAERGQHERGPCGELDRVEQRRRRRFEAREHQQNRLQGGRQAQQRRDHRCR